MAIKNLRILSIVFFIVLSVVVLWRFPLSKPKIDYKTNLEAISNIPSQKESKIVLDRLTSAKPKTVNQRYDYADKTVDRVNPTIEGGFENVKYTVQVTGTDIENRVISIYISNQGKEIYKKTLKERKLGRVFEIETDKGWFLFFDAFTGGAHCCTELYVHKVNSSGNVSSYMIDLGDIDLYSREDFFIYNDDLFFKTYSVKFAYFETSFADSSYMFFPIFYRLDDRGFELEKFLFKDYYLALHKEAEIYSDSTENSRDCFPAEANHSTFSALVNRFALGYMAGINQTELKNEFIRDWCVNNFTEFTYQDPNDMAGEVLRKLNEL